MWITPYIAKTFNATDHIALLMRCLQPCVFKVDYTVEVAGNKEFGSLFLQHGQQQENVALTIVQSGWAKVNLDALMGS